MSEAIPDKLFYKLNEVCQYTDTQPYVLRFWESEFPQLKPSKSSTGQRMYRRREVEHVVRIKKLLYDEGYTIAGARQQLKEETRAAKSQSALPFPAGVPKDGLKRIRQGLLETRSQG